MALNYWAYRESNKLDPFSFGCGCNNHYVDEKQDAEIAKKATKDDIDKINEKLNQVEAAFATTVGAVNNNTDHISKLGELAIKNEGNIADLTQKLEELETLKDKLNDIDNASELKAKLDNLIDSLKKNYYTRSESGEIFAPLKSVEEIEVLIGGIHDSLDELKKKTEGLDELKNAVTIHDRSIMGLFTDKADKDALESEINRAKEAERGITVETERAKAAEEELKNKLNEIKETSDGVGTTLNSKLDNLKEELLNKIKTSNDAINVEKVARESAINDLNGLVTANKNDISTANTAINKLDNNKASKDELSNAVSGLNRNLLDKETSLAGKINTNTINIDAQKAQISALKIVVDGKVDSSTFNAYTGLTNTNINNVKREKADLTALTETNDAVAELRTSINTKADKDKLTETNERVTAIENVANTYLTKSEATSKYMPLLNGATLDDINTVKEALRIAEHKLSGKVDENKLDEKLSPLVSLLKNKWRSTIKSAELSVDDVIREINEVDNKKVSRDDIYTKAVLDEKLTQLANDIKRDNERKINELSTIVANNTKNIGYISELKNVERGIENYDNTGNGILDVLHNKMHGAFGGYDFQNELVRIIHRLEERIKVLENKE